MLRRQRALNNAGAAALICTGVTMGVGASDDEEEEEEEDDDEEEEEEEEEDDDEDDDDRRDKTVSNAA